MDNRKLVSTRNILDENGTYMEIRYYLCQHFGQDNRDHSFYGIEIEKYFSQSNQENTEPCFAEAESTGALSDNIELVEDMVERLSELSVTPCNLVYIMDDMAEFIYQS